MSSLETVDLHDARYVRSAAGTLRAFNEAGVLAAADVHVALRLARLCRESDDSTLLGTALAVRAPRLGSVCVDLATIAATAAADLETTVDLQALPWPQPEPWVASLASSRLVAVGESSGDDRPLRLVGTTLYLDRYWRDERSVADDLIARSEPADDVDEALLADGLARLFQGDEPDLQRLAAATCVLRRLAVVGGGPGTGKTTTVTRILALLDEQADASDAPKPLVALAAPTGKGRREARGSGARRGGRGSSSTRRSGRGCSTREPQHSIACSAGVPAAPAVSGTIVATSYRTTSSSSTRRRWCLFR